MDDAVLLVADDEDEALGPGVPAEASLSEAARTVRMLSGEGAPSAGSRPNLTAAALRGAAIAGSGSALAMQSKAIGQRCMGVQAALALWQPSCVSAGGGGAASDAMPPRGRPLGFALQQAAVHAQVQHRGRVQGLSR